MSNIGLTCDVCGRTVQEIKFFNSKKVCLKCYKEINKKAIDTKIEDAYFALLDEYKIIKEENEILHKALELACLEHKIFGYCCYADPECDKTVLTCEECCAEYFKDRAKEQK